MKLPLVTIAIPTYNRADNYLNQALAHASGQSYENIEILVSDNCSTDNTEDVVCSFSDPRLKYFRQKTNLGRQGNSNFLLSQAKGDYFQMFHDDDLIDKDFIYTCMESTHYKSGPGILMTGSRVIDETGGEIRHKENLSAGLSLEDFILSWYQGNVNIYLCCTLFNTKTLRSIGGFEERYNHYDDVAANFKCSWKAGRLDIPEVKASFRKHPGSITSSAIPDIWCRNASELLDLVCSLADDKKNNIRNVGLEKSAKNIYMYANLIESRMERIKAFYRIYKYFGYRHLPQPKYCMQLLKK